MKVLSVRALITSSVSDRWAFLTLRRWLCLRRVRCIKAERRTDFWFHTWSSRCVLQLRPYSALISPSLLVSVWILSGLLSASRSIKLTCEGIFLALNHQSDAEVLLYRADCRRACCFGRPHWGLSIVEVRFVVPNYCTGVTVSRWSVDFSANDLSFCVCVCVCVCLWIRMGSET